VIRAIGQEAKRQGIVWELEREGARHTVYRLGRTMIPVARHMEIDDQMAIVIFKECEGELGKAGGADGHLPRPRGTRRRYWLVRVHEVDRWTQARHLREVEEMARDLVAVMLEVDANSFQLEVTYELPVPPRSCSGCRTSGSTN